MNGPDLPIGISWSFTTHLDQQGQFRLTYMYLLVVLVPLDLRDGLGLLHLTLEGDLLTLTHLEHVLTSTTQELHTGRRHCGRRQGQAGWLDCTVGWW